MRADDVRAVAEVHAASWRDAYRGILSEAYLADEVLPEKLALWRARLAGPQPRHLGLVAEDNGIAGFAFALTGADARWGTMLDNFHVHPDRRGRGIGTRLLHTLTARLAADHPDAGLFLWVYERNLRAMALYDRLGGERIERAEEDAPGGGKVPAWMYAWRDVPALHRDTA